MSKYKPVRKMTVSELDDMLVEAGVDLNHHYLPLCEEVMGCDPSLEAEVETKAAILALKELREWAQRECGLLTRAMKHMDEILGCLGATGTEREGATDA